MSFQVHIKDIQEIAQDTTRVIFNRPEDLKFRAGQYLELVLPDDVASDARGLSREMSIASAPADNNLIEIAFRNGESAFKKSLQNFAEGVEIRIDGPFGTFTLPEKEGRSLVFLAGGIGVTPFRSMIREAQETSSRHNIKMLHFDRLEERMAFLDEWRGEWREGIEIVPVVEDESWSGEKGLISKELLERQVDFESEPVFFVAGPQGFVTTAWQILHKMGVDELDVRTEEFSGY